MPKCQSANFVRLRNFFVCLLLHQYSVVELLQMALNFDWKFRWSSFALGWKAKRFTLTSTMPEAARFWYRLWVFGVRSVCTSPPPSSSPQWLHVQWLRACFAVLGYAVVVWYRSPIDYSAVCSQVYVACVVDVFPVIASWCGVVRWGVVCRHRRQ